MVVLVNCNGAACRAYGNSLGQQGEKEKGFWRGAIQNSCLRHTRDCAAAHVFFYAICKAARCSSLQDLTVQTMCRHGKPGLQLVRVEHTRAL